MGLTREQALECFASDDLIGIGMEADAVRRRLHPEGVVSYALNAFVNASSATVEQAAEEALGRGATGIVLYGFGGAGLGKAAAMLNEFSKSAPELSVALLESELAGLMGEGELSEILKRLRQCGLRWIEGDGSESSSVGAHRAAHAAGLTSVASLRFGEDDAIEERIAMLEGFRDLQDDTSGITACSLHSASASSGRELDDPTAVEYLKTLAICRMVLDNIDTVQANWQQQGPKVMQMSLRFGANDVGSLFSRSAEASEEEVRRLIRDAGFRPAQRDSLSTAMFFD